MKLGKKALKTLGSFVNAMKLKHSDIEFSLDLGHEPGTADSGDLESDLIDLFIELGKAAQSKKTALVLFY
ncbi:MAG: hypothetical protein A2381_16325 [Bdellovibrionales bacterium RIFOXYB1_FULL_37_110]|nr:MAG: hypothetical protein A2181_06430 [Bdellovibrionales bacterium RIFOXYA1_FULL_38_20]OFZ48508.1 MAG: hypothetical protein A2417_04185 [Bdellovibrionales bacterium RIFOXYC1_FULL_37_79]OFZ57187.1 MAG: hypothetical protein A2381_16325 [Bdellovibrionales bacterium RIFOXYB1_FULL_37_110]OFZ63166.1 MAG: hypothetical protein A2577_15825 [Bdellovibrionales bacterium RIFOXYD1_FULL_36_51]HAB51244.1 hypothetical protein [Ignavibacteriales bacterium]